MRPLPSLRRATWTAAVMAVCSTGRAETVNCTPITSLPYTISAEGVYCLTGDLSTAQTGGAAITIVANNVVLDLNGHKLGGLSAGPATGARGIYAFEQQNITIKNGTVRGFFFGIQLNSDVPVAASRGHVIERVRLDQNTHTAIVAQGHAISVRRCQVMATGGSTALGPNVDARGIYTLGNGNRVIDNDVATVTAQGFGTSRAIDSALSSDLLVVNNRMSGADFGINYGGGSAGKYRDNLTRAVTTPYSGGTNAGNNN